MLRISYQLFLYIFHDFLILIGDHIENLNSFSITHEGNLNSLNFEKVDSKKFPVIKILKKITKKNSLFDTVLVSINDELVSLFLKKKIKFLDIS